MWFDREELFCTMLSLISLFIGENAIKSSSQLAWRWTKCHIFLKWLRISKKFTIFAKFWNILSETFFAVNKPGSLQERKQNLNSGKITFKMSPLSTRYDKIFMCRSHFYYESMQSLRRSAVNQVVNFEKMTTENSHFLAKYLIF